MKDNSKIYVNLQNVFEQVDGDPTNRVQNINLLKAQGANLTTDQFMVVSEAGVNLQTAMIEAAVSGDKKAHVILNMQSTGRRN